MIVKQSDLIFIPTYMTGLSRVERISLIAYKINRLQIN